MTITSFQRGRVDLNDEFRDDHLSATVKNKNINAVHRMTGIGQTCDNPTQIFGYEKAVLAAERLVEDVGRHSAAVAQPALLRRHSILESFNI
ncbi:hypothetical protein EVAR_8756_1 [Eumeta japonica]|uniref:Uncharacterized protein n=1 Tax=Eumeta variegata TaxID=151549 RepID=A0A4C1TTP4_EUMVA|nr:hypothetical protein EVAR_8756_1 [Eumeta japonica]